MSELEIGSFLLTPFNSPFLNKLERGNQSNKRTFASPLSFSKRGEGGELREGCGGRRSRHCLVAVVKKINTMIIEFNNGK